MVCRSTFGRQVRRVKRTRRSPMLAWPSSARSGTLGAVRLWIAFLGGAALAAAAFEAYPQARAWLDRDPGILVGGQVPPESTELEAWLAARERWLTAQRATLLTEAGAVELSFGELGLSLDVPQTARSARDVAQHTSLFAQLRRRIRPSPAI